MSGANSPDKVEEHFPGENSLSLSMVPALQIIKFHIPDLWDINGKSRRVKY